VGLGERDGWPLRGINFDGTIVLVVHWRPPWMAFDPTRRVREFPAGYYFEGGSNIAPPDLIEAAAEPSDDGWERMRTVAVEAFEEWQRANPNLDPTTGGPARSADP